MGGNRPQPAIYQVKVKKMRVEGIRIPHIQDGVLRPYASVRVGVKADEAVTNPSVSYVVDVGVSDDGNYSKAEWYQTHVLTIHTPLEKSKVYIDVFNDKDSYYANGSLIGSACYDLSKHVELYGMGKPEIEFGGCELKLPAIGDNDKPFVNGYIRFQVYVFAV